MFFSHRVLYIPAQTAEQPGFFLLGSFHSIFVFRADSGDFISTWSVDQYAEVEADLAREELNGPGEAHEPPSKKRKIPGEEDEVSEASSAEIVIENGAKTKRHPKNRPKSSPVITLLRATHDGRHIIVATSEDKSVRVLELDSQGILKPLNERFMPRKPCALALTSDQQTILCADKFGDVYALPLQKEVSVVEVKGPVPQDVPRQPAASLTTVHTKRNRDALQNQLTQIARGSVDMKQRETKEFQPVLGHVSLLTDIVHTRIQDDTGPRNYILSADRDEHIRVSRGLPQAHIIEGFCLGHTEFISRLCIPTWAPHLLISGGGDDFLMLWRWLTGECILRIDLRDFLVEGREAARDFAISGLWTLPLSEPQQISGLVIVALEGSNRLFSFVLEKDGVISTQRTVELPSNILDVAIHPSRREILWTVDNTREPNSTEKVREDCHDNCVGMHRWNDTELQWEEMDRNREPLSGIYHWMSDGNKSFHSSYSDESAKYGGLLYSMEHLRKRHVETAIE